MTSPAELPRRVDPIRLAERGAGLEGKIDLIRLIRATSGLESTDGQVSVDLAFGNDMQGRLVLRGTIKAGLELACQRCLRTMHVDVDSIFNLGIVQSERQAAALPDELDPLLVVGDELDLEKVVEDELILAMPQVPIHAEGQCEGVVAERMSAGDAGQDTMDTKQQRNPFSVLESLKSK